MDEVTYTCDCCGEEIVIPVDPSAGGQQSYVEDCPVCCNPMEITVYVEEDGTASATCRAEQDRF